METTSISSIQTHFDSEFVQELDQSVSGWMEMKTFLFFIFFLLTRRYHFLLGADAYFPTLWTLERRRI